MNAIKLKCTGKEEIRIIKQFKYKLHMKTYRLAELAKQTTTQHVYSKTKLIN